MTEIFKTTIDLREVNVDDGWGGKTLSILSYVHSFQMSLTDSFVKAL